MKRALTLLIAVLLAMPAFGQTASRISGKQIIDGSLPSGKIDAIASWRVALGLGNAALATIGVGVPSPQGQGASGTWAIDITGTASGNLTSASDLDPAKLSGTVPVAKLGMRTFTMTFVAGGTSATFDATAHPVASGATSLIYIWWNGFKRPFAEATYNGTTKVITLALGNDPGGVPFTFSEGDTVEGVYYATD